MLSPANLSQIETLFQSSWSPKEAVIGSTAAAIGGVGEPTLNQWGDISFVAVYNHPNGTYYDKFDSDPFFVKTTTPVMPLTCPPSSVPSSSSTGASIPTGPSGSSSSGASSASHLIPKISIVVVAVVINGFFSLLLNS